ncbi:MAG TPA: YdeI/OmpD-associated family protein, partial [Bacteroidia bacterium]|nr:YdeI/OmpD-associated family protein [Bacteroidia bacterium]
RYQYYTRRKPKSIWSKVNKGKVAQLLAAGKMTPAGQRMIDIAKENGMWTYLDRIDEGLMPEDLVAAFALNPAALTKFEAFPPSAKKGIFQWIISAKGMETRAKRISETVEKAALGQRANEWKPKQA